MQMEIVNTQILKQDVEAEVKPADGDVIALQKLAEQNADEIMMLDLDRLDEKRRMLKSIEEFGLDTIQNSSRKNTLLQTTIGNLSKEGEDGGSVSNGLADLHREIKDLDPSPLDFSKTGVLGKLFNPIRRYFEKYEKADGVIQDIIVSLDKGKNTLKNDNTTLDLEEESLREITKKLNAQLTLGMAMDQQISAQIELAKARGEDEEKIHFVTDEILFPLRQRVMDMQQMIVVNQQGIIAMEVVKRNNKELIRGVDRAKTVTVTALRTAVMVASALYNQKIVLHKIELLNETTGNIIAATGRMLKEQGAAIQKQATESSISPDVLKQAFQDALSALEDISIFKQQALPKMHETVAQFRTLAETGEKEITRLERAGEE
ncbi:MAG: toxic anion resistance protein [Oscillospiraceae bacterium]|nr:toxic anion resistance protein [Oscillospiraceae bacterium]